MLNKDLYEKYLQKKAKKLGVSVEELKNNSSISQTQTSSLNELKSQNDIQIPINTQQVQSNQVFQNNYSQLQTNNSNATFANNYNGHNQIQDKRENKYALIGYPLGHSLSKVLHDSGFKSMKIDAKYDILETSPEDLIDRLKMLKNENYRGFNITIPLKMPIALFVDEVDETANITRAINTVVINPNRTMKGYNTDVLGFKNALKDFVCTGKVAGILGTGGASHAATVALAQSGIKQIRFYTRNIPNSLEYLNYMRNTFPNVQFDVFQIEHIQDLSMVDLLVNTTPIGMLSHSADLSPLNEFQLKTLPETAVVYDVIYNPKKTVLLKIAERLGLKTINGVDMLIEQAVAAEMIWTGNIPDVNKMRIAMLENL